MKIPGLTGTWQQRNAQLYKKLGSPLGTYTGNLQQNTYLLQQIAKGNYGQTAKPKSTPVQPAAPQQTLAQQYTDPLTGDIMAASEIPQFQNVLPFYESWGKIQPGALLAAESQIRPEAMRQYNSMYNDYMSGMASAGGQRFGTGLAGVGNLKAASSRDYNAMMQDWLGQQRSGFENLWYNPSMDAWNKARTQVKPGGTMEAINIPTWEEYAGTYGKPAYGEGQSTSLF